MFEWLLVNHCAPTLAGIKTANLFMYSGDNALERLRYWNRMLSKFGIRLTILKQKDNRYLVYIYRVSFLSRVLSDEDIRKFLSKYGYSDCVSISKFVKLLSSRICEQEFPHEIGIFLGYPLEDVKLFIENHGQNYKVSGVWKVYTNEEQSVKCFEQYKKCTHSFCELYLKGKNIAELCVA